MASMVRIVLAAILLALLMGIGGASKHHLRQKHGNQHNHEYSSTSSGPFQIGQEYLFQWRFSMWLCGWLLLLAFLFAITKGQVEDQPTNNMSSVRRYNRVKRSVSCGTNGVCRDIGGPHNDINTRCGGCHSCTYKGCCHVAFTNPNRYCDIPGWRSGEYQ